MIPHIFMLECFQPNRNKTIGRVKYLGHPLNITQQLYRLIIFYILIH